MTLKNIDLEGILQILQPILPHRDKVGYVAARNTRIIQTALTEYATFKNDLIKKYGERDEETGNYSLTPQSATFNSFQQEFDTIANVEQEVDLMTLKYDEVVGVLTGTEILQLEFMLTD